MSHANESKALMSHADREIRTSERLLTIAEAALLSGAPSEYTIRRHIAKGAIQVRRIGPHKRIRIVEATFLKYLDWQ